MRQFATETAKPKNIPTSAYKHLGLEQVNPSTWKVINPKGGKTEVPASHGYWAGYRTTKALAWVIDLGYGQWMARCGNEVCNPTNLAAAKRQALAMAMGGVGDYEVTDPIKEYQGLSAIVEDRYARVFTVSEVQTPPQITNGEHRAGDDCPLDYHADSYPKLPPCLDRTVNPIEDVA